MSREVFKKAFDKKMAELRKEREERARENAAKGNGAAPAEKADKAGDHSAH